MIRSQTVGLPTSGHNTSGILYSSTSYDDNFAENKNTLANSQFGFLPSILKSFYSFKH
jgi:hypothetical protein